MNFIRFVWKYVKNMINFKQDFSLAIDPNIFNSFSDKESLAQFNPNISVLQLPYSKDHQQIMDIFRFILNTKEISLRVFDLTTEIVKISPWNYEVWVIRR